MNEFNHPTSGVGPFKAYLVSVYTVGFRVSTEMLVLGCASHRSAILTALRECSNETRALGVREVINYDSLVDRCE
jgi:hypothetical protein